MKKIYLLLLSLLAAVGCHKDDSGLPPVNEKDVAFISINAFETKCQLGTNNLTAWSEGDKVGILGNEQDEPAEFSLSSGAGYSVASFEGKKPAGDEYIVYYPSSGSCDGITFRGTLDTRVSHSMPDHPLGTLPMWGKTDNLSSVSLTSLCGVLSLGMRGSVTLKSVSLDAGKPVSGSFLCNLSDGTIAIVGGLNVINMDAEGAEIIPTRENPFYFILPPGEYDTITLTVTASDDDITFVLIEDIVIEAGVFTPVSIDLDAY